MDKKEFSKVVEESPLIKETLTKMQEFFKDNPQMMVSFFGTLLASAKLLGEFILQEHDLKKLPTEIQYALALVWNSYACIYDKERMLPGAYSHGFQDYFESGSIDDRFAYVVKQMHEICKNRNLL